MAYQKTIWSPGDTISSAALNKIEEHIAGVEAEIAEAGDGLVSYADDQGLTAEQKATARSNIGAEAAGVAVKFTEAQVLTPAQKAQAQANLGLENMDDMVSGRVRYDEAQELTEEEKAQAQANIGLDDIGSMVTGTVKYSEAQTLSPEEKAQALENLGLDQLDNLTEGTVKYSEAQTLNNTERGQARSNIGAAAASELTDLSGVVSELQLAVDAVGNAVTNITRTEEGLRVDYSSGSSQTIGIDQGLAIDAVEYDASHYLHFYDEDGNDLFDPVFIEGGGGGGASGYAVRIINGLTSTTLTVASNQRTVIPFTYTEYYGSELQNQNGLLTVQYKLASAANWITYISNQQIPANVQQRLDVTDLLTEGSVTNIRLICANGRSDEDAQSKTIQYNITSVALNISTTFNASATYTGNLTIPYTCTGAGVRKTVYLYIDGTEYTHVNVGESHNQQLRIQVRLTGNYSYGAHSARLWFATPEGATSNEVRFPILYDNGVGDAPIVGATLRDDVIENGETLYLDYVCYTPGRETTESLSVRVYSSNNGAETNYYEASFSDIQNNRMTALPISRYPDLGTGYIELRSGTTTSTITFTVTEVQTSYEINPVETGLVYSYRPAGYTNSTVGREEYVYELEDAAGNDVNIYTELTDFNWVNDGYIDGESLTIAGAARMNIQLPILTTDFINKDNQTVVLDAASGATVTTSGRTIEFEFELDNVTNQNSVVFSCLDANGVGFVITPQVCYLLADGQAPVLDSTGFIENEESIPCAYIKDEKHIRVSFVIQPKTYTQDNRFTSYANIFINGEYANSYLYDETAVYNGTAGITIGSDDCVTKLYDVRMYNRGLTRAEVLRNHMNSDIDIRDRIMQNRFNDILNSNGHVDYAKARLKYPCLLFIGNLSNHKNDRQYIGTVLTKPDGAGSYQTEFSMLDRDQSDRFVSSIKVQGTSSQRFMRKNFKVYLVRNKADGSGTEKVKYVLKGYDSNNQPLSKGESTLCFKMDYMSTDHANTFNANIADTLFNDKAPGSLVQNTIWGFRCLLFNMAAEDYDPDTLFEDYAPDVIQFAGDGCLNNDKSNVSSFGLKDDGDDGADTLQQKWEFKDNSNPLCTFTTDRLMEKIYATDGTSYKLQARNGLESCYPDEGDLDDAGIDPDYSHIQVLFSWVYQRANFWDASTRSGTGGVYDGRSYTTERALKRAIFIREFPRHFNMEHALIYYLFIEWVALCDNRAKNMFLSCKDVRSESLVFTDTSTSIWDCVTPDTGVVDISKIDWENSTFGVWYTDLYDLDSCFGAENSGYIRIPYYADWNYILPRTGTHQFNGYDSRLWCMFEDAFADEIKARAKLLTRSNTGSGTLNYAVLRQVHITENAELVCPAVVNEDMEYKYEDAWTKGYWDYSVDVENPVWTQTSAYKYLQRGSRTEQKESFIYRRSVMLYSKYQCDQFLNDQLAFRCGTPVAIADSTISMAAIQAMWLGVTYGDSGSPQMSDKRAAGQTASIISPNVLGRSDNIHIHGASNLTELSSLAAFHPYEIGLTNAGKLKTLLIGSNAEGYTNGDLSSLDTSACVLLDTLNVQGCTGFTDTPINLTANTLIRAVYAGGSTVPYFMFANGGILETLELGRPKRIVVLNQPYMTAFSYDSLDDLVMLRVENTPNMVVLDILAEKLADLRLGIRLVGIDETITGSDFSLLRALTSSDAQGKQLNADGNLVNDPEAWPVITGTIHCNYVGDRTLALLGEYYPNLTIDYTDITPQYVVTFVNEDGTQILDKKGNPYIQYVDQGGTPYDPVAAGDVNTPVKQEDQQYTYTYSGWDDLNSAVLANKTIRAQYTNVPKVYTVRWFAARGGEPLKVLNNVTYGAEVTYNTNQTVFPTLDDEEANLIYKVFTGWDKSTGFITGDTDVYAVWDRAPLPTPGSVELKNMTPAQIVSVAKNRRADEYWTPKDYVDIPLGKDFDYSNVRSEVVLQDKYFGGTVAEVVKTNIKLFDADAPDFTLAIDYEFTATTANATLASCMTEEGAKGFRLRYNSAPDIQWGDKHLVIGHGMQRGIVVLRHYKGSSNLYVMSNNPTDGGYNNTVLIGELVRTQPADTDAVLAFGGLPIGSSSYDYPATGWIHWCKIWYADLGSVAIRQLATWPHETLRMEYIDSGRYRLPGDTAERCAASFVANHGLALLKRMNSTKNNTGGWPSMELRTFLNSMFFSALPFAWQAMLTTVRVTSIAGNSTDAVTSEDKVYLASGYEMNTLEGTTYEQEGSPIAFYATRPSCIKFAGLKISEDAQIISSQTDPTLLDALYTIHEGDVWINEQYYNVGYMYFSAGTVARHGYIGSYAIDSSDHIDAAGTQGGKWIVARNQWTRTASTGNTANFAIVSWYGGSNSFPASNQMQIVPCFSL